MTKEQSVQFLEKLDQTSDEVNFYFSSSLPDQAITEIALDYNLPKDKVESLVLELVINNFNFTGLQQRIKLLMADQIDQTVFDKIFIDFLGKICLPLDNYLETDVAGLIRSYDRQPADYQRYVINFQQSLEEYLVEETGKYLDEVETTIDLDQEIEATIDLLTNHLDRVLQTDNLDALLAFNRGVAYVLNNQEPLVKELENILLDSQIKITKQPIVINEKTVEPTAGNWLNDFITSMGVEQFDSLVIADYMIKSENIKSLSDAEREIIQKLITLYLNIKFYPDSMNGKAITDWFVLPLPLTEQPITHQVQHVERQNIEEVQQTYNQAKLAELQQIASSYNEGSLERLAVEEEIIQLKQNIKN